MVDWHKVQIRVNYLDYSVAPAVGMHRILFLPDIRPAGYPVNPKAGYRISGSGRTPNIRPDILPDT
jgi:hypothetical protein